MRSSKPGAFDPAGVRARAQVHVGERKANTAFGIDQCFEQVDFGVTKRNRLQGVPREAAQK